MEDNWPEVRCVCELLRAIQSPEFAADECEKIGMTERLAVEPFGEPLEIEAGGAKYRANVLGCFSEAERLERELVVEADGGFSETAESRKIV